MVVAVTGMVTPAMVTVIPDPPAPVEEEEGTGRRSRKRWDRVRGCVVGSKKA